jgi:serine/threonine protein kinase
VSWLSDDAVARLRTIAEEPDFSATRYRIVREIARGGMGVVYEAEDAELRRRVAVKVLAPELASDAAAQRMMDEARVLAQLEHPGIVPLHDAGTLPDGRVFYVMKLVRGHTLAEGAGLRQFLRICEAVAFAHARGIVHRDLKPSNVMVDEFGEVLVMDWGVGVKGTRGFMPPEQERGEPIDATADVFALGAMLRAIVAPPLPRRLAAIATKAMDDDPHCRYPSARELADDVARYLDGEPIAAYRETAIERLGLWLSRNRALLAVVGAYLVMRLIVLLFAHR